MYTTINLLQANSERRHNMIVVVPSTPAQYFHCLRRQIHRYRAINRKIEKHGILYSTIFSKMCSSQFIRICRITLFSISILSFIFLCLISAVCPTYFDVIRFFLHVSSSFLIQSLGCAFQYLLPSSYPYSTSHFNSHHAIKMLVDRLPNRW